FLRGSALLGIAMAMPGFLAACAKKLVGNGESLRILADARVAAGSKKGLSVFLGGEDYVSGPPNYVAIGLVRGSGDEIVGDDARVWMVPTSNPDDKVAPLGPFDAPWSPFSKPEAAPAPQGMNALDLTFPTPGTWTMLVETEKSKLIGSTTFKVKEKSKTSTKIAGEQALPTLTPTVGDHRGVEPICTRTPGCGMHEITLKDAIASGKPTVFIIATPRFCSSRTCGPNVDELLKLRQDVGDAANFIHAEVYVDDKPETVQTQKVSPTFAEWSLPSDPWLFVIDAKGSIAKRFEGPITAAKVGTVLAPLLKG
ncbi:MAG: hypothetical protein LC723_14640, partial [Actinobacteria bacterium]|nr:hypothetical protein [Actinomycetota bacterium]